jgi:hypothetical protein
MRTWLAKVIEDGLVLAASLFEGVREHGEALEVQLAPWNRSLVVGCLGKDHDRVRP